MAWSNEPESRLKTGIALVAFVVGVLFVGDRLRLSQPEPQRLRFVHTYTTESERAILDDAVAEFERAHSPIKIEQVVYNSETYQTIGWRLQFQGGRQSDILFTWQGFKVEHAIENRWALDLMPYLSKEFLEAFVPSAIQVQRGGIYLLPQSIDISNLVWYNQELFDKFGLHEPKHLAEWLQLCGQLRKTGLLALGQGNRDLWPMGNFGAELLGQTLGADGLGQLFARTAPARIEDFHALRTFDLLRRNGCFDLPGLLEPGGIGALGDIDAKVLFLSGKSAQHIVGSWFLADIEDARQKKELKFRVGVFPVPAAQGEIDAMTAVTTGFQVNKATKNPRAAVAFLELLLSRKYQSRFAQLGNLSARRDAGEFTNDPLAKRLLTILAQTEVIVPPPDTGYRPEQAAVFYEMCGKLLTGKLSLEETSNYWADEKKSLAMKGL